MACMHVEEVSQLARLRDILVSLTTYNHDKHYRELHLIESRISSLIPDARKCIEGISEGCYLGYTKGA